MFVTLRKAAQILSEIDRWKKTKRIDTPSIVVATLDLDDLPAARNNFLEKNKKFMDLINTHMSLTGIAFTIRNAVAKKNYEIGVTEKLGQLASIEATLKMLEPFLYIEANKDDLSDFDLLYKQFVRQFNTKDHSYGRSSFSTNLFLEKDIAQIKYSYYTLKKAKNQLTDELLGLNTNNKIEISEEDYKFLVNLEIL